MNLYLTACLASLLSTAWAQITQPPNDVAGRVGESINITCRANIPDGTLNGFEWLEYVTVSEGRRIFSDPSYPDSPLDEMKYAIHGQYDLEVKSVQLSDGGNYGCKMFSDASPQGAHMFVFDRFTQVATRMVEGDTMNVSCEARFGASPRLAENQNDIPVMELMVNGMVLSGLTTTFTEMTTTDPYILRGYAPYTARAQDSGEDFMCMVTANKPFNYQAIDMVELDIHFAVQDPILSPINNGYYVGEVINCTAEGSPLPNFRWEALSSPAGDITVSGPQLLITDEMINDLNNEADMNSWRCIATNYIGVDGEEREAMTDITFRVMPGEENTGESNTQVAGWKIGVGVGVPLAVIFIVIAIVLGIWFARKQKAAKNNNNKPPPDFGADNRGAAFPGDAGDLSNGIKPAPIVSTLPNPLPEDVPANRSRDSPGYADLGVKQISNSYPGVNVSMSSVDSFDDSHQQTPPPPPPTNQRPPPSHVNPSFQSTTPPRERPPPAVRPHYLNVGDQPVAKNHPDTFV